MPFKWQINASSVGKLMGYFGNERQTKAIADTWLLNLKRMPRFGVVPSYMPVKPTVEQIVQQEIKSSVTLSSMVSAGVNRTVKQGDAVKQMKRTADEMVGRARKKASEAAVEVKRAKSCRVLKNYSKIKSALSPTKIGGYFSVSNKIYKKISRKCAQLSTLQQAESDGWKKAEDARKDIQVAQKVVVIANQNVKKSSCVAKHIQKTAVKEMNTTRGIRKEATDLEMVQKMYPNVVAGNTQAKFLAVSGRPYKAFVIGRIDGIDAVNGVIYELKHRQSRLFRQLRGYEQVQCLLYMQMFRVTRLTLVETYKGEQLYYPMEMREGQVFYKDVDGVEKKGIVWKDVQNALETIVENLNRAEQDEIFRNRLVNILF